MIYIKKEDAKTLASELSGIPVNFLSKFDSLPSIDPQAMIKEKFEMCREQASDSERHFWWMIVCEQLLNKLP